MKFMYLALAAVAVSALSACSYRPCPRPCAPAAPSYVMPACAPAPYAQVAPAYHVKHAYQAPVEK